MAPPQGYVQITVTPGSLPGRDAAFNATALLDVTSKRSFSGPAASRLVLLSTLMELADRAWDPPRKSPAISTTIHLSGVSVCLRLLVASTSLPVIEIVTL